MMVVAVGTLVVVAFGSLYKIAKLRAGGRAIAETLGGGRLLDGGTSDPIERKVLNVVEEMAVASGTPVPPVYLLDREKGINAFAAGYSPGDAVVGITRGCAELLSRDELQGVVAHEFSHILNGDMRLNIRLIGVVHGILVIGLVGSSLARSVYPTGGRHSRRSRNGGNAAIAIFAIGMALVVIGYVGVFFGKLIKAGVSRQREYLADAATVQFMRYPQGISGALKKIGGLAFGSKLLSPRAEQASHMFFGQGIMNLLGSALATHPPLPDRIRRIEPSWNGGFPQVERMALESEESEPERPVLAAAGSAVSLAEHDEAARPTSAHDQTPAAVAQIGQPTNAHLAHAAVLLLNLSPELKLAARESYDARAVVYSLLLDPKPKVRSAQRKRLGEHADPQVLTETRHLDPLIDRLNPHSRLPLLDLCFPALRALSPRHYEAFKCNVAALIRADDEVDLFEWSLQRIILRHLEPHFTRVRPARIRYEHLQPLREQCALFLSMLAYVGHDSPAEVRAAFNQAVGRIGLLGMTLRAAEQCSLRELDRALDHLAEAYPASKRKVVSDCGACLSWDKRVTVREAELFQAICDCLDCPVPLLVPGQALA